MKILCGVIDDSQNSLNDVDEFIPIDEAILVPSMVLDLHKGWGDKVASHSGFMLKAKITKHSKAGNIFIHVSKTEK